jgi:diguanylate cyclase (GGDEF)-like protein
VDDEVRDRLLTYVEQTTDFVGVTDDSGRVVYLNPAALRRLGRSPDEVSSLSTADLFPGLVFDRYFDEIRPVLMSGKPWSGVLPVLTAEGTADVWFTIVGGVGLGGDVGWLVTSGRNVTSWINDRNLLSWRATHDELTGVARRVVLGERIEAALARVRRSGKPLALIYLDLDRFEDVNDRFGHPVGDTVLAEFGRRLSSAVREVDTVVRVGGDEFVVLLEGVADRAQAELLRSRLVAALTSSPVPMATASTCP